MRLSPLLFILFFLLPCTLLAQDKGIRGKVTDAISGEPVAGASVILQDGSGTQAKTNGDFLIPGSFAPGQNLTVIASAVNYQSDTLRITWSGNSTYLEIELEPADRASQSVKVTASIAKNRRTPVAFSGISARKLEEMLGNQDLPMVLNFTPGVYATQQGGGAGDARISIRGFNQRNILVMVDGIPVNDMENGMVYWSNWFGLSDVTRSTQVQRGLGASRVANPAIGGTMNIITRGIENKFGVKIGIEAGDHGYSKQSIMINSGRLKGNWGIVAAFTARRSNGYVDGLFDDMYSYFLKTEKQTKKHLFSFTAVGAPQSHGQRIFRARLSTYSAQLAKELNMDTTVANTPYDKGRKFNAHWGYLNRASILTLKDNNNNTYYDTVWSGTRKLNEATNMFHKPQFYLKDVWNISKNRTLNTVAYLSVGRGGGTSGVGVTRDPSSGLVDFQKAWFTNKYGTPPFVSPVDPLYSSTLNKSTAILRRSVNNHNWIGLLSTYSQRISKNYNFNGGVDARAYSGIHYREVYNLLGGNYYRPQGTDTNPANHTRIYREGDIFGYNYTGRVNWGGLFGELEYTKDRLSAVINLSTSYSAYRRIDYFKPSGGKEYTATPWKTFLGYTAKAGANYNINKRNNIFANLGWLVRPPRFNNVFDNRNRAVQGATTEQIRAIEAGYGYKSRVFSLDANAYLTYWKNRPLDFLPTYTDPDGNIYSYNINGLKARHMGIELSGIIRLNSWANWEFSAALGDWLWRSGSTSTVLNDNGDSIGTISFDAKGVHVGDAAQNQFSTFIRFEPVKGLYFTPAFVYFGKQYADFEPSALKGDYAGRESFRIPDYWYLNFSAGYSKKVHKDYFVSVYLTLTNITDNLYISDAQHRDVNGVAANTFNPKNLEVFVSPGTRGTLGIKFGF